MAIGGIHGKNNIKIVKAKELSRDNKDSEIVLGDAEYTLRKQLMI